MAGKKRFKEPVLIKYKEKLDEVTRWGQMGSHCDGNTTIRRRRRHRGIY